MPNSSSISMAANHLAQARTLFEQLASIAREQSIMVKPYLDSSLPFFSKLAAEQMSSTLFQLREMVTILSQSGEPDLFKRENQLLWTILTRMKLKCPEGFFESLDRNEIVEFYSVDHVQMFRSINFLQVCSYSLEEIYCRPWFELYSHSSDIHEAYLKIVTDFVQDRIEFSLEKPVPPHWVEELDGADQLKTWIVPRVAYVVRDFQGRPAGYLHIFRATECIARTETQN